MMQSMHDEIKSFDLSMKNRKTLPNSVRITETPRDFHVM